MIDDAVPGRPRVDQLRPGETEKQERRVARPIGEMLDQVEQRGSAQWMSSTMRTRGRCARELLERLTDGPEDLLRRRRGEGGLELLPRPRLAEDLNEWEVGDPLAVRKAAAGEDGCFARQGCGHLAGQARLADPRGPQHRDEPATTLEHCLVEGRADTSKLFPAPDEGRVEPPFEGGSALDHPQETVGHKRLRLAPEPERLDRLDLNRIAGEADRLLADQDLARLRGLLEPGGDVDGVAGGEPLLGAGDDLAGVHADAELEREAVVVAGADHSDR